jgi:hypothetical protein
MNFRRYHVSKNLFDKNATHTTGQTAYRYTITGLTPNQYYTCSTNFVSQSYNKEAAIYFDGGSTATNGVDATTPKSFRCDNTGTMTIFVRFQATSQTNPAIYDDLMSGTIWIMLNKGSTPLPYEPYSSEVWHDIPYYQHKTATDTLTLPAVIYPNDTSITVGIKGQSSQNGTPTPQNPVDVVGTGERTGNLYNINAHDVNNGYVDNAQLNQDGTTETWKNAEISEYIPINGNTAYTFNGIGSYNAPCYGLYDENKQLIGAYRYNGATIINFTSPSNVRYFRFTHIKTYTQAMTVEGTYTSSTMPKFEPYGYKIPISSAGQTTPIYLGDVQTTRQIQKVVLTGGEYWVNSTSGYNAYYTYMDIGHGYPNPKLNASPFYCNIAQMGTVTQYRTEPWILQSDLSLAISTDPDVVGGIGIDAWKSYLQQQYAAETPVTVWYVLAEPTTTTLNEPLMKIGEYADSLTTSIPCTAGENTLDVQTTVQPSEVTAGFSGWHPVEEVHEMNSHWESTMFELGTITGYGVKEELKTRIRTKNFIDASNLKVIKTSETTKVFMIAWTSDATFISANYCVGGWNGTSFGYQTGLWLSEIDVESIVETYPTYKFAIILRYDDNKEVIDFEDLLALVDFYPKTW